MKNTMEIDELMSVVQPNIKPIPKTKDGYIYELVEDYSIYFEHPTKKVLYILLIPKGFQYDGATVFSVFTVLSNGDIARDGLNRAAALVHDWMYRWKGKLRLIRWSTYSLEDIELTRLEVERIFYDILLRSGVPTKRAWQQYQFVKMFAWVLWIRKPKKK